MISSLRNNSYTVIAVSDHFRSPVGRRLGHLKTQILPVFCQHICMDLVCDAKDRYLVSRSSHWSVGFTTDWFYL
jgi:hypothetical protein